MVKLMRVDYRLIHGQVAVSWTSFLGVNSIVVANDEAAGNQLTLMTMKLAKPAGVDLVVCKVSEAAETIKGLEQKKVFLVCGNIKDAYSVIKELDGIDKICLGNVKAAAGKKKISEQVFLNEEELGILEELNSQNVTVECQTVPSSKILTISDIRKIWGK